jgi:LysR family transcriptional regulator, nitrogen assimilation regulatory protein
MEIRQMHYFLCLAEEGNVTRAARHLNIVQPALSMQIAKLEAHFGMQLFRRDAQGVSLTPAGETLLRLVTPIVRDAGRVKEEMAQLDGKVSGRVKVGLITSVAQSTLAPSFATIAQKYPDVQLSACEGYTDTLIEWVTSGQLDVAIINLPRRKVPLATHHILDEEMVLGYGAANSTVFPRTLRFEDIARYNIVIPSKRHGLRLALDNTAAEAGIELRPRLEIDTLSAICSVVASTQLVTVLPSIALHQMLITGQLRARPFVRPGISRSIVWVHSPRRIVSAATRAVIDIIQYDLIEAAASAKRYVRNKVKSQDVGPGRLTKTLPGVN